jgi:hypothetical protein
MHVWLNLTDDDHDYLDRCARIRGVSCGRLLQRVVRMVVSDQLVLAVLDDESRVSRQEPGELDKSKGRKTHLFDGCH